jgi:hypothetical protein
MKIGKNGQNGGESVLRDLETRVLPGIDRLWVLTVGNACKTRAAGKKTRPK